MTEPDDFSGYVQYWESHKDQTKNPLSIIVSSTIKY